MQRRYAGLAVLALALFGNNALARPKLYTLVDLVEQAPWIIAGQVASKTEDLANVVVEEVLKGEIAIGEIQFQDIPPRIPKTSGLRLVTGDQVMLFLNAKGEFFTADHQSKLDLSGCDRLTEFVSLYLRAARKNQVASSSATRELRDAIANYQTLATQERVFVIQLVARGATEVSMATIDQVIEWGMADTTPSVRWEAFVAARRLDLVGE